MVDTALTLDTSSVMKGLRGLADAAPRVLQDALEDVAREVLRLSQEQVPHDEGTLANSGTVQPEGEGWAVGYNKPYAARLHEHPEYHFQKGRKGKYLEDPIKNNVTELRTYVERKINSDLHV